MSIVYNNFKSVTRYWDTRCDSIWNTIVNPKVTKVRGWNWHPPLSHEFKYTQGSHILYTRNRRILVQLWIEDVKQCQFKIRHVTKDTSNVAKHVTDKRSARSNNQLHGYFYESASFSYYILQQLRDMKCSIDNKPPRQATHLKTKAKCTNGRPHWSNWNRKPHLIGKDVKHYEGEEK
jgi:hypothetical protein